MDGDLLESMVQDGNPEQDIGVQEQFPPQTDPEPEMGAAAAAAYDTSPPPLRQNPPIPAETAHLSAPDMAQLFAMLAEMSNKMDANMQAFRSDMRALQGEMRQVGQCLQAGIEAILCSETRTTECVMATPRAGANELRGSVDCVCLAGEDKLIWETCWARVVTEKATVTVTQGGKLIGVTETCTSETRREVTGLTDAGDRETAR